MSYISFIGGILQLGGGLGTASVLCTAGETLCQKPAAGATKQDLVALVTSRALLVIGKLAFCLGLLVTGSWLLSAGNLLSVTEIVPKAARIAAPYFVASAFSLLMSIEFMPDSQRA